MSNIATRKLFLAHNAPLSLALRLIQPHSAEIHAAWRKKLRIAGLSKPEVAFLSSITLQDWSEYLQAVSFEAFQYELERLALTLEIKGFSEDHVILAISLYLECCIPCLFDAGSKGKEPVKAVVGVIALAEYMLLGSYCRSRAASLRRDQQRERHSLSRDLHDDIGHNLLVLKLYLEMMSIALTKKKVANLESQLQEALSLATHALDSLRHLILDLGPAMVSQFGFIRALRIYTGQFALRTGIAVKVEESGLPEKLPPGQEIAIYRILQEALSNALQHSRAKNITINIGAKGRKLALRVEDDGIGFDVATTISQGGFGIMGMRERVEILHGRFRIKSTQSRHGNSRHGTQIEIDLPLESLGGKK